MAAGGGYRCAKFVFFLFNSLLFLSGAVMMLVALWLRVDNDFQTKFAPLMTEADATSAQLRQIYLLLYALALIGALLVAGALLGCCGACCDSGCLLTLFFTVVLSLFLVQLAACTFIIVKKDTLQGEMVEWWRDAFVANQRADSEPLTLDNLHRTYECCGASGCFDYDGSPPKSCQCYGHFEDNRSGCVTKAFDRLNANAMPIFFVMAAVFATEILAMILACSMLCAVKNAPYPKYNRANTA